VVRDDSKRAAKYRRRAGEARRMADRASTPAEQADLLEVEKRWLTLARNHEAKMRAPSQKRYPSRKRRGKA
jgi:hypothetical protein